MRSILASFQNDMDAYNEGVGQLIGGIVGALLFIGLIVWLIKRSRKK